MNFTGVWSKLFNKKSDAAAKGASAKPVKKDVADLSNVVLKEAAGGR